MSWFKKHEDTISEKRYLDEERERELSRKEFESVHSICLDCKNAFVYCCRLSSEKQDLLVVRCKKVISFSPPNYGMVSQGECWLGDWSRKCVSCSEFEGRKEK
jgi:hypothetical protein